MAGCCDPRGCDEFFNPRFARRVARRYRRKGLDRAARRMVAFLESRGVDGATVLEIGGGVGEIGLELLGRGAARALTLELSPAYDAEAARLAREAGVEGRVERRRHDIAVDPAAVEPADVVVLHRVVCCYPDYERLLGAAGTHARRLLVFSHPPRNPSRAPCSPARTSSSGRCAASSARSPIRRRRCSRCSSTTGWGQCSRHVRSRGTWPVWSAQESMPQWMWSQWSARAKPRGSGGPSGSQQ